MKESGQNVLEGIGRVSKNQDSVRHHRFATDRGCGSVTAPILAPIRRGALLTCHPQRLPMGSDDLSNSYQLWMLSSRSWGLFQPMAVSLCCVEAFICEPKLRNSLLLGFWAPTVP